MSSMVIMALMSGRGEGGFGIERQISSIDLDDKIAKGFTYGAHALQQKISILMEMKKPKIKHRLSKRIGAIGATFMRERT